VRGLAQQRRVPTRGWPRGQRRATRRRTCSGRRQLRKRRARSVWARRACAASPWTVSRRRTPARRERACGRRRVVRQMETRSSGEDETDYARAASTGVPMGLRGRGSPACLRRSLGRYAYNLQEPRRRGPGDTRLGAHSYDVQPRFFEQTGARLRRTLPRKHGPLQLAAGIYACAFRSSHSRAKRKRRTYEASYAEDEREEHGGASLARTRFVGHG
jgi:hypothetical protein